MPIRTICIPVAEIIDGGTKSEFYADLRNTLKLAVQIANLSATECLKQDDPTNDKKPKLYTYPIAKGMAPGAMTQASSICRAVESAYLSDRFLVRLGRKASRSYRSQPWPLLHNKSDSGFTLDEHDEYLSARIRLLGQWWDVRLAGGSNYRDQIKALKAAAMLNTYKDSKIWVDRKGKAILGICCEIPVREQRNLAGTMRVSSHRDSLLYCTFDRSSVPFVVNADECKQWKAESSVRFQRLRQDRKSDANRKRIASEMNRLSDKMSRRMGTLCHEVASRVVGKAVRSRVSTICLDLTIKSYMKQFPWFDLAIKIKYKAEAAGIAVVEATQALEEPDVDKPHVYFKFAPVANRVKIGMTAQKNGQRHGTETDSAEVLTILAVDNQPPAKLRSKERHYHATFQEYKDKGEWFLAEPVIAWLREREWLGNAGNLSQIMQVLDTSSDVSSEGHLWADSECPSVHNPLGCSHNAVSSEDITELSVTALAVDERTFED